LMPIKEAAILCRIMLPITILIFLIMCLSAIATPKMEETTLN